MKTPGRTRDRLVVGRGPGVRHGRRRAALAVAAVVTPALLLLAVATPAEAGSVEDPGSQTDVGIVLGCLHSWVSDAGDAFAQGGQCDGAQQILASRVREAATSSAAAPEPTTDAVTPAPVGPSTGTAASASAAPGTLPPPVASSAPSAGAAGTPVASSAAPVASLAPVASSAPSASPVATVPVADPARPEFDTRPRSGPITCRGKTGVVISGLSFDGIRANTPAITIDGCHDVLITENDFAGDAEPIYVKDSTDVRIVGNRYRDIAGPHERNGSHRGNFTQWENSFGGLIRGNTGIGGDTEDIVSIYKSGGMSAAQPLIIEDNVFRGTTWSSASGSGIMLGDGGGGHIVVRRNTLVDVGQVGIGVAGGSDISVVDNVVSGSQRALSNVGIYAWGQGAACDDVMIARNRVDFVKADGTRSPMWDGGNCGTIAGWASNLTGPLALGDVLPTL